MNMLVYYDGSSASINAVKLAQKRAKAFNAKIFAVSTITRFDPLRHIDIQHAEQELKWGVAQIINGDHTEVATRLLVSKLSAGEQLLQFARNNDVKEIIIGVERTSELGKLLLGSITQKVVLNADCPVITVK